MIASSLKYVKLMRYLVKYAKLNIGQVGDMPNAQESKIMNGAGAVAVEVPVEAVVWWGVRSVLVRVRCHQGNCHECIVSNPGTHREGDSCLGLEDAVALGAMCSRALARFRQLLAS